MGALIPIEPDHLCSLIALNAGEKNIWHAFCSGFKWGLGHSMGMLTFCAIFLPLQSLIDMNVWEFYGNYVAGGLLMGIGFYFLMNESKYLEEKEDGNWVPKSGACNCSSLFCSDSSSSDKSDASAAAKSSRRARRRERHDFIDHDPECQEHDHKHEESTPLIPPPPAPWRPPPTQSHLAKFWQTYSLGDLEGLLLGMVQGLCCPSCIAGLAFIGQVGARRPGGLEIALFFAICFASIGITSAFVAAGLAAINRSVVQYLAMPTRAIFRAACALSIILGISWIVLNAGGRLHVLQYTESIENRIGIHDNTQASSMMAMIMSPKSMRAIESTRW